MADQNLSRYVSFTFSAVLLTGFYAAMFSASATAQNSIPEYVIREDEPVTGTNIRRKLVRSMGLPLNKRFHELTADEKEVVSGWYEAIEPGDEPPYPTFGLQPIFAGLSKAQNALRVSGELFLVAEIGADGKATQVKALASPSAEMTTFASKLLLITEYKPAICRGKPCRMEFPLQLTFETE